MDNTAAGNSSGSAVDIDRLQSLLQAKDDTQRFVGLALLKSVLDSSPETRDSGETVQRLWECISPKFIDRLLRTGTKPCKDNAKEMLDLAVSVLHTFAILLPDEARRDPRFHGRIPGLVKAVLYSSEDTTKLILQLLQTLVSVPEGATALVQVDDPSPLTEIAPTHAAVLHIFSLAWLNGMAAVEDKQALSRHIDATIQSLVASFTSTDAVTLLEFIGYFLRHADARVLPGQPRWLRAVVTYIQSLVSSRPTPEARSAYTNAAASILQVYPSDAPRLLFCSQPNDEKAFSYLLINLLLIDIRSSAATLLQQLNTPEYPETSRRLASAFDVIAIFLGYLVQSLDDESFDGLVMSPDNLLKLRTSISETMSVTIEYLRDRWDASVAGAMGLHPDARTGAVETATGSHRALAWDSIRDRADEDVLILSATRALAIWLREDDSDILRKETTGLMDMFMDLYKSSARDRLDFRSAVLVALEGVTDIPKGRVALLANDGWKILTDDLVDILQQSSSSQPGGLEAEASRATEIVRVLLPLVEQETGGTREAWMDLITKVAAWYVPDHEQGQKLPSESVQEAQIAVLQLCCGVLAGAGAGMRRRYGHSIGALHGIAAQLAPHVSPESSLRELLDDVLETLNGLA